MVRYMAYELCKKCGWMHFISDECPPRMRSTAARKDVQEQAQRQLEPRETLRGQIQSAGTQAPPVDTNSETHLGESGVIPDSASAQTTEDGSKGLGLPGREVTDVSHPPSNISAAADQAGGVSRSPQGKPPVRKRRRKRNDYMRVYMQMYRARKKAERKVK